MKRLLSAICLIVVACLATRAPGASAQVQTCGNFETATGMAGWMLTGGPGVGAPRAPTVVTPYAGWAAPVGSSKWVSVDPTRGSAAGDYTYEYAFCACRKDNSLRVALYADNGAKVFLNGTQIFATTGSYNFTGAPKGGPYSGPAFVMGTNVLRIVVHNDGSVTGLDAVLAVTGASSGCCR